ncbi:MAG: hypothetical protein WBX25_14770, partial [Rhodomicrobium sp.]
MSQTKRILKAKRSRKVLTVSSVLGVAGLSLAATSGGSEAAMPSPAMVPSQAFLAEEEISDVSLATFQVYTQENIGASRSLMQEVRG